jgi:hypothetical protein
MMLWNLTAGGIWGWKWSLVKQNSINNEGWTVGPRSKNGPPPLEYALPAITNPIPQSGKCIYAIRACVESQSSKLPSFLITSRGQMVEVVRGPHRPTASFVRARGSRPSNTVSFHHPTYTPRTIRYWIFPSQWPPTTKNYSRTNLKDKCTRQKLFLL